MNEIVSIQVPEAAEAMRLSVEAGWNQTLSDWQTLLANGSGFAIRDDSGKIIASSVATPYSPLFGWIGMVLVDERHRRLGLAGHLMRRAIDCLSSAGLVPMLDATPAGQPVYERLGFTVVEGITRWRRSAISLPAKVENRIAVSDVLGLDATVFGVDRSQILKGLASRPGSVVLGPQFADGYALCRQGRTATHIGPVVATQRREAEVLLRKAIGASGGPAIIDVPDNSGWARQILETTGFLVERPLTRMALGRDKAFGRPEMVVAIAGPEFG